MAGKVIGERTTSKGKLDPTRWGWKVVSSFDGQERNVCVPGNDRCGIFRKHLYGGKGVCRRCDVHRSVTRWVIYGV